ncbi:L-rhamnose mutarotase [Parapedobacter sp. 2B3]|uniref:L-rhamnose mutarotase n=1 Tax=Parapedobacter sp. 2B3 TaxID=3342381 RepID=UPI0035B683C0
MNRLNMKSNLMYLYLFAGLLLFSCQTARDTDAAKDESGEQSTVTEPQRVGMVTGLSPEKAEYYKELHADTWEGVLAAIRQYNIRNYSIYLQEIEGKLYLFSYYEYIGDDYDADMKRIAADTTTQRWWQETDPCQLPLPEALAKGEVWTPMEEVFHTD